jgi:hypothetical protein
MIAGRALVIANISDFLHIDQCYKASSRAHAGLVLVSTKAFPQDRSFIGALDKLLGEHSLRADAIMFLPRRPGIIEKPSRGN